MWEQFFTWAAAAFAFVAAALWWRASTVTVDAPAASGGVGALLGGGLISVVNGRRIDLHRTLESQSWWNARGAAAAAGSAVSTGLALAAKAWVWP